MRTQELVNLYNEECVRTGRKPMLKINQQWLDQFNNKAFSRLEVTSNYTIDGIAFDIDNSVDTFEFTYVN